MSFDLHVGDCVEVLRTLEAGSVQACVTSPPYFGLRDYGVEGQIGLEETPEAFVAKMVEVFREVRRVLRDDGTLWLNLGDSYAGSWGAQSRGDFTPGTLEGASSKEVQLSARQIKAHPKGTQTGSLKNTPGIKAKDLIGIPWMVAFALRADGWYLRQDIIWHKPNPMPESVTDRCTKAHEYLFLLSKSKRYYFDADAIREKPKSADRRVARSPETVANGSMRSTNMETYGLTRGKVNQPCSHPRGSNKRDVWTVPTFAFPGAHFATYPPKLIEPCILAGAPEGGLVLDPFTGSGTTGEVALKHGRRFVGIELNPEYAEMARRRITEAVPELYREAVRA